MKFRLWLVASVLLSSLFVAGCGAKSPEQHLASAKEFLQKNDARSAVIEIKNALQANPELGEARYLLGSTLLQQGDVVAAEVELRKARAAGYIDALVVPDLARATLMLGQAKKVVDEFGQSNFGTPAADANLQTTLAVAYSALGKQELAHAALAAALSADPVYAPALLASARQKAVARDFDGAMQIVDGVIAKNPADLDAWKLKGDILLYAQGRPDDALAAYRKALEINAESVPAHLAVLTVLMQQGKIDDAEKQLEQLKKIAPKSPQTKYFDAQLAYHRKDFKRARELSQQLLQLAPNSARLLQLAGAVELQLGELHQAESYLSAAVQAEPQLTLAKRLLIVTYLRSGQAAKALTALNEAAGKDGISPELYSLAGEVYLMNGDAKQAEDYFAKALKLDPQNAAKRTRLALTHLAGGQPVEGFDELQNIAASDAGDTTADLALISVYVRRQEFDKALAAIDRLEAKQPDKPNAAYLRGRVQLMRKDNAAARKSFERALSIDPSYFAAVASLAAMDVADKKPAEAKRRFENLLAKNPKNVQALLALAQLAAVTGAPKDEIAASLNKAIDAAPAEPVPRLLLIDLLLRNKDTEQATSAAQKAVAALPNNPDVLAALGRVQQASGDLNQAVSTYINLVAMRPLLAQPLVRLAEAQAANKNLGAAEQSLRKALAIQPDLLDAQRGLILLMLQAKRFPDAIAVARQAQTQRPKAAIGFVMEGDIDSARQDWGAAAEAYRAAQKLEPSTPAAIKLHVALQRVGKQAEADRYAAAWIKAQPKDAVFLLYLADTALAIKDFDTASKQYQAVLKIQPDNAPALNNMAWLTQRAKGTGALAYAQRANQLAPNQPAFMDTLATILSAQGQHAKAIELQTQAVNMLSKNESLRLNLAKIYIAAGDKTKARNELQTLIQTDEKDPLRAEAVALLKGL